MVSAAEIVFFPVKPHVDVLSLIKEAWRAVREQPGFRAVYYGSVIRDENISCLVFEWENKAAIEEYLRVYDRKKVRVLRERIIDMEAGLDPFISFTQFESTINEALEAGVTAIGYLSLPENRAVEPFVSEAIRAANNQAVAGYAWNLSNDASKSGHTLCITELTGYPDVGLCRTSIEARVADEGYTGAIPVDVLGKRRSMVPGSGVTGVQLKKIESE